MQISQGPTDGRRALPRHPDELKSALQTTGPSLIDIRIDPASYGEDLERLRG